MTMQRDRVLEKYPQASARQDDAGYWWVYADCAINDKDAAVLGLGETQDKAWTHAAYLLGPGEPVLKATT
jgi:hypothetical protein